MNFKEFVEYRKDITLSDNQSILVDKLSVP